MIGICYECVASSLCNGSHPSLPTWGCVRLEEYPIFAVLQKGFDFIRYLEASFIEIPAPTKALGSARCVLPVCCQFYFGRLRITSVL